MVIISSILVVIGLVGSNFILRDIINYYDGKKDWNMTKIILFNSLLIFLFGVGVSLGTKDYIENEKKPIIIINNNDSLLVENAKKEVLFEDSVFEYIKFLNIKHPELVLKQAKIESGNFKSKVFLENNNMFGMKIPNKRANLVNGENNGYATYNNWQESVVDYALYQTYSAKGMTKEEYIRYLGSDYAEDINYSSKLK